ALDRLLRAVNGFGVLTATRNGPQRRLLAIAGPVALASHRVPARLMLPMVIAAADHQPLLGPDDLRPDGEALAGKALCHRGGVQGTVPHVGDGAGKARPCGGPIGALVVAHLADPRGLV